MKDEWYNSYNKTNFKDISASVSSRKSNIEDIKNMYSPFRKHSNLNDNLHGNESMESQI